MDPQALADGLNTSGIYFIRFVWCDNGGVIRGKAVHREALRRHLEHGVGITAAQQAIPALADFVAPGSGLGPIGEVRLRPDWGTFAALPYAPGHARVFCDMTQGGRPWSCCPRTFLRRQLAALASRGLTVQATFENEFYLLRPDGAPLDDTVFAATRAMDGARPVIDDLAAALQAQGLGVEMYYPESGPGQHELSVRESDGGAAADRQVVFRETTHAIAARHGLLASFLPKPFADAAGSGCHLHLSLWQGDRNVTGAAGPEELSDLGRALVGGILAHLPALMALTTPSVNSFRRVKAHAWSGAFRCWGFDNREAAVRVPTSAGGGPVSHFELKTCDATCNPFLALGAVLAAGLDGIARATDPGPPTQVDPGALTEAEQRQRGIDPLPASLGEALARLERDAVLLEALGPDLARAFVAVRRAEWEALQGLDIEAEVRKLGGRY